MPTSTRGVFRWLFRGSATIDDMSDRLNHVWTVSLSLILAAIISWKQGVSKPIVCWVSSEFTFSMRQYVNSRCWNSYGIHYPSSDSKLSEEPPLTYLGTDMDIPYVSRTVQKTMNTTYYQRIPIILVFQALLFKLPNILFYILHSYSGIRFTELNGLTEGSHNLTLEDRISLSKQIGRYIYGWCKTSFPSGIPWRLLTVLTCFMKLLFCINIVCQLVFVDRFLAPKSVTNASSYGTIIYDNIEKNNATYWQESEAFPRAVLCGISIRQWKNMRNWVVLCDLPMNNFSERAYMFLWMWFVVVAVVTLSGFLVWVLKVIISVFRKRYISEFLEMHEDCSSLHLSGFQVQNFASSFLGEDGVTVLKLIAANSSDLIVQDAVIQTLKMYVPGWSVRYTPLDVQSGRDDIMMEPIAVQAAATPSASALQNTRTPLYPGLEGASDHQYGTKGTF